MGEATNLLIIIMSINIVLFIGLNGMGSGKANLVQTQLFTESGFLSLQGDKVDLGSAAKDKPELSSTQVESDLISFKSFDALQIVWEFLMAMLNIITLPFTLAYNLFMDVGVVGQLISLLIFAPLCVAYVASIIMVIKGVGS